MRAFHLGLGLLLASASVPSLKADPAILVTDLETRRDEAFSASPEPLQVYRDELYFWSDDPLTGRELWKTDGTPRGTRRVKDVCPGRCDGRPPAGFESAVVGDRLFFPACDGARGCQLWKTDGTRSGTEIVGAFADLEFFHPSDLTPWNGRLYLAAQDPVFGYEPFRTDGTPEGTELLSDLEPGAGSSLPGLSATEDHLFLHTSEGLWTSDGTPAGTERIATLPATRFIQSPATLGDLLVFSTDDGVWRSDGSAAGTFRLWDRSIQHGRRIETVGDRFFVLDTTYFNGTELWTTDGTVPGSARILDGLPYSPYLSVAFGGRLYIAKHENLWRTDGTEAGTRLAARFARRVTQLLVSGGELHVVTSPGIQVRTGEDEDGGDVFEPLGLSVDFSGVDSLFPFGDVLAAAAYTDGGSELAVLDPSTGKATVLTRTVDPGSGEPRELTAAGSRLLFLSDEELYAAAGLGLTRLSAAAAGGLVPTSFGTFLFDGGLSILDGNDVPVELLALDYERLPAADLAAELGDELFFLAYDAPSDRYSLWRSDGTPEGTGLAAGGLPSLYYCFDLACLIDSVDLTVLGGRILVTYESAVLRADLETGTFEILFDGDLELDGCTNVFQNNVLEVCRVDHLTRAGDRVFFTSAGEIEPVTLWQTDGTPEGTRLVRELHPPPSRDYFYESYDPFAHRLPAWDLTAAGGRLFFVVRDADHGEELWTSDGTAAGTHLVRDIRPGPAWSYPRGLTAAGDRIVFAADDGATGHELWTSDGTAAGTVRVADLYEGPGSSLPRDFTAIDGVVVFTADDGATGAEPWRSDLTAAGTWRVDDLNPGPAPSSPERYTAAGSYVYMNAGTRTTGFELYAFPRAVLAEPGEGCAGCLVGYKPPGK